MHVSWAVMGLVLAVGWHGSPPAPDGFTFDASGPPWKTEIKLTPDGLGGLSRAVVVSFPGNTWSEPGQFAAARIAVTLPDAGPAVLSFRLADTFTGPTAGFHFAEVLVDETLVFEHDVAGGTTSPQPVEIDLRQALPQGGRATVTFRLAERKAVSNFAVTVYFIDPVLRTAKGSTRLLPTARIEPPQPLPPDLPLPSLPLAGESWTRTARIVQPWGRTQWDAILRADERAPWLAEKFGFNAIIVLPPEAHNAIRDDSLNVTEAQFQAALSAYRAAGFRIILYSAVMHCGHAPVWQDGTLSKTHPEWSQRGPKGEPVTLWGAEWLCPSTEALPFTIEHARKLVEHYAADAVMLDNNEFFNTPSGLTCHCDGCRSGFREYAKARFGDAVLGEPTADVEIPTEPGPLYNLWLHWRNRVWAEATERFRVELRKLNPDVVLLANTQYLRSSPDLATDLQYAHEDAVLSESRGMSLDAMVDKLFLGRALARNRPLWNYLGTFQEGNFGRLVSPERVSMNVSTAFACGARPWVVYYGFFEDPEANTPALERMAATLRWHDRSNAEHRALKPYAPVRSLVSLTSRNCRLTPLIPTHLAALRKRGVAVRLVEEQALLNGGLEGCRVLLVENATCLSERSVAAIRAFVEAGGLLIASPETGLYDEIGRPRPRSALWTTLGLSQAPLEPTRCGKGEALATTFPIPWDDLRERLQSARFVVEPETDAALVPYLDNRGRFVVYVCSEKPLPASLRVTAPGGAAGHAILCSPDQPEPRIVDLFQ